MMERQKVFDEMMHLMMNAARYIKKYESIPRSYGTNDTLYSEECHTIDIIGRNADISMTEIARSMGKTKSAISQLVDRLVKKEMLEKHPHPDNDRNVVLKLTDKGRQVFLCHQQFDAAHYGRMMENLSGFSVRELTTYLEIQKEINRWLKKNAAAWE